MTNAQATEHERAWQLLPWYLNGTLKGAEFDAVDTHLGCCLVCRREVERLRLYAAAVNREDGLRLDPEHAFDKLMARIEHDRRKPWWRRMAWWQRPKHARWRPVALAAAVPLVVLLAVVVFHAGPGENALYTTLTDTPADAEHNARRIRAVFEPDSTVTQLDRLLNACRADIVAGPNSAGAYTLESGGQDSRESSLACLRESPQVMLAEPVHSSYER